MIWFIIRLILTNSNWEPPRTGISHLKIGFSAKSTGVNTKLCVQANTYLKSFFSVECCWLYLHQNYALLKTILSVKKALLSLYAKIQQTKMLVTWQMFGGLFLFRLIWQYSSNHKTYIKGSKSYLLTCSSNTLWVYL